MNSSFHIIADNELFLIVYKNPNVSFHSEDGIGLFESVKQQQNLTELYPVHRLDKVTSGLLVMAKTLEVNNELAAQFQQRNIEKYYLAISSKKPKKKQGVIKGDMEAARRGAWKLTPEQTNPAITQFMSKSLSEGKRLFIIKPHTGRTHQIRVALKSIGSPIQGDSLYADAASCLNVDRVYLHAYSLAFTCNGVKHHFTELPREGELFLTADFHTAMQDYLQPWQLAWPKI